MAGGWKSPCAHTRLVVFGLCYLLSTEVHIVTACEFPEFPEHSIIADVDDSNRNTQLQSGDTLEFACETGFVRSSGNANAVTVMCQADNTWDMVIPDLACSNDVNECDSANICDDEPNAVCQNTFGSFRCVCRAGYTWDDDNQECDAETCVFSRDVENAYITSVVRIVDGDGDEVGIDVNYLCRTGFRPETAFARECRSSVWTFADGEVTCSDFNECAQADDNNCGSIENSYCVNTYGSYQCLCELGYRWMQTGDGMMCQQIDCGDPGTDANADLAPTNLANRGTATFVCKNGFRADNAGSYMRTCLSTGWSTPTATCEDETGCQTDICGAMHGCIDIPGSYICACAEGYMLGAPDGKSCVQYPSGLTTSDLISCGDPGGDGNADMDVTDERPGSIATYRCLPGFRAGALTSYMKQCVVDGGTGALSWTVPSDTCTDVVECPGVCDTNADCTDVPGSYTCTCRKGYTGDGTSCNIVTCGSTPAISNTDQGAHQNTYGSRVMYTCHRGHHLLTIGGENGQRTTFYLTCNEDGEWSPYPYPQCIRLECPDPGVPDNTIRHMGSFFAGDKAMYTCPDGFKRTDNLPGSFELTCQDDGTWTSGPHCEDINECTEVVDRCGSLHTCVNRKGFYECSCADGYRQDETGVRCVGFPAGLSLDDLNPCELADLLHMCINGVCEVSRQGEPTCRCDDNYTGTFCQLTLCQVFDGPCVFGNCDISPIRGAYCKCLEGYEGDACERRIEPEFSRAFQLAIATTVLACLLLIGLVSLAVYTCTLRRSTTTVIQNPEVKPPRFTRPFDSLGRNRYNTFIGRRY